MREQERLGSTRIMRAAGFGRISLEYTDAWSAFDRGASLQLIPGIGVARCACAAKSFMVAKAAGLLTHFIEKVDERTIVVGEFAVPGKYSLSGRVHGTVLDAEWIWRQYVYGSLLERIIEGEINPMTLGFVAGATIVEGTPIPILVKECTTKFEVTDRHLSNVEARARVGLSEFEWRQTWDLITKAVEALEVVYSAAGFYRPDGKLEVGLLIDRVPILVDVFGTPDEDRIIDKKTGNLHCKDLIRNYLKATAWKAELDRAKIEFPNDKSMWPPYPELPAGLVELVAERYAEVARRYTSVPIV